MPLSSGCWRVVSHTVLRPCRVRSVFLPPAILWRSLVFSQLLRVHNLIPEVLVELVRRNQEQWCLLGISVAYTLLSVLHTLFFPVYPPNQIFYKSIRAGGQMSGHCAETSLHPVRALVTLRSQKQWYSFSSDQELSSLLPSFYSTFDVYYLVATSHRSWVKVMSPVMVQYFLASLSSHIKWHSSVPHHFSFIAIFL